MERVMELPHLYILVDIYIDVGNTNISSEDKTELTKSIHNAVKMYSFVI